MRDLERYFLLEADKQKIPCYLTTPDYGGVRRVVLGVHGITGSAEDVIQAGIAGEMALFGGATLRIDLPAHGKNPCSKLTLMGCVDTVLAAAAWVKAEFPDVEDLGIFASGFGAYVTLIALEALLELPGSVRLAVQTPSVRMHETLLAMANLSKPTFWAMDRITFPTLRPLEITYRFYEELEENIALSSYPIPILILHGEEDDFIRQSDIQSFRRINDRSRLVTIPGASHRFTEEGAWDMVLDLVRDWFEFQQVLVTDWE